MIYLKTDEEVELLREANLLVGKTLAELARIIQPGVTTRQLDVLAETFIRDHGAEPTFKYPKGHHSVSSRDGSLHAEEYPTRHPRG